MPPARSARSSACSTSYGLDDVRKAELDLKVTGEDGFVLNGKSSMSKISRDRPIWCARPAARTISIPTASCCSSARCLRRLRIAMRPNQGFTHKIGDVVEISSAGLGSLVNTVRLSNKCPPWTFGISALMANLAKRGLL
jgi:fumarylacetoacetate (FAA) hydrolase family protein